MTQPCPLCSTPITRKFHHDQHRGYRHCPVCNLIFTERDELLDPKEEKARYDLHENDPNDPQYRQFLNQLVRPLLNRLPPPPAKGLDFGSGPGPTLPIMLAEQGYTMRIYDHYYARNPQVLEDSFDFVTCSETFEHFYIPKVEWYVLINLLKPRGWLGIMTLLLPSLEEFPHWYYKNDLTHVSFYSKSTFEYMAQKDDLKVEFIGKNIVIFQKPIGWQQRRLSFHTPLAKSSYEKE